MTRPQIIWLDVSVIPPSSRDYPNHRHPFQQPPLPLYTIDSVEGEAWFWEGGAYVLTQFSLCENESGLLRAPVTHSLTPATNVLTVIENKRPRAFVNSIAKNELKCVRECISKL